VDKNSDDIVTRLAWRFLYLIPDYSRIKGSP